MQQDDLQLQKRKSTKVQKKRNNLMQCNSDLQHAKKLAGRHASKYEPCHICLLPVGCCVAKTYDACCDIGYNITAAATLCGIGNK